MSSIEPTYIVEMFLNYKRTKMGKSGTYHRYELETKWLDYVDTTWEQLHEKNGEVEHMVTEYFLNLGLRVEEDQHEKEFFRLVM